MGNKSRILVTGVAGFIGSHLAERLIKDGNSVIGIDCFTDYYSREVKEANIRWLKEQADFTFYQANLVNADLTEVLKDVDIIFHEAAQAGVRASWGKRFHIYTENNVFATQRLLEATKEIKLKKFIFASSSSVYGDAETYPTTEDMMPRPISPYGATKLAGEHLCYLYWRNFDIPVIILRYFTVYGPRQRPDMAFYKFIRAMLNNEEIIVFGDGNQTRDFTYIDDIIEANTLAMNARVTGEIFNIGGGSRITLNQTIDILERTVNKKPRLKYIERQKGDMNHTAANINKAENILKYKPKFKLEKGIANEVEWLRRLNKK